MSKKINIAFIGNQIAFGGGATSFYLLVKSLKDRPINKYVFVSEIKSNEMKQNFYKYADVVELIDISEVKSSQTSKTSIFKYIKALWRIKGDVNRIVSIVDKYDIDIIHFNNSVFSHLYPKVKNKRNVKIITHVREMIFSHKGIVPSNIVKNISVYSDRIITISNNESKVFPGNTNVLILANPFDFSVLEKKPRILRKEWGINADVLLIGMMGRFAKSKGQLLFLKVLNELKKNHDISKLKFVVIGVAKEKPRWKRIIKLLMFRKDFGDVVKHYISRYKLEGNIVLIPYTKNVFDAINTLDIVVRPSLYKDPWGRDIIESMALNKPIIATGESEYFIKNNYSGFLVNSTIFELKKAIMTFMSNNSLVDEMGANGRKTISDKCNIVGYGNNISQLYETL